MKEDLRERIKGDDPMKGKNSAAFLAAPLIAAGIATMMMPSVGAQQPPQVNPQSTINSPDGKSRIGVEYVVDGKVYDAQSKIPLNPGETVDVEILVKNLGETNLQRLIVLDDTLVDMFAREVQIPLGEGEEKPLDYNVGLLPGYQLRFTGNLSAPDLGKMVSTLTTIQANGCVPHSGGNSSSSGFAPSLPSAQAVSDTVFLAQGGGQSPYPSGYVCSTFSGVSSVSAYSLGMPSISIVKSINGDDANSAPGVEVAEGEYMNVTYLVRNTSDVPLRNVAVTDDVVDSSEIHGGKRDLAPGEETVLNANIPAPAAGVQHVNVGTVTADYVPVEGVEPVKVRDEDNAHARSVDHPGSPTTTPRETPTPTTTPGETSTPTTTSTSSPTPTPSTDSTAPTTKSSVIITTTESPSAPPAREDSAPRPVVKNPLVNTGGSMEMTSLWGKAKNLF